MKKIIHLDEHFQNTGEPTVTPVLLWNNGRPHVESISKYASVGHDYFKTIEPIPGHSIVYVLAVSSWEKYGENRNGDGFNEFPYMENENPPWISQDQTLTNHYKSFEKYAHNYRHHVNKDPLKSVGSVMKAFWNARMHRVELLIDLVNEKAPDLAERIEAGEYLPVSMGTKVKYDVCLLPETLVRTSDGYREIQDISAGAQVRTHKGRLRAVVAAHTRTVTDGLVKVTSSGAFALTVTEEHPFYVLPKNTQRTCHGSANGQSLRHQPADDGKTCKRCGKELPFDPVWRPAGELQVGDYTLTPVDSCAGEDTLGLDACRMLGLYAGNGSAIQTKTGVQGIQLSINAEHDSIVDDAIALFSSLGDNPGRVHPEGAGKGAVSVCINDKGLGQFATDMVGRLSRKKRLSERMFELTREEKLAFVGGYIDTDGSYDAKNGICRLSSVNRGLLLDTQRLLHSTGIHAACCFGGTSTCGYNPGTTYWYLVISAADGQKLRKYTHKIPERKVCWSSSTSFFSNGYWCTPIKKLESVDGTHTVFNLQVEEDESYVAEGLATHNCSICGNRAPTRAQYCNHLRFQMRDVINGKKVAALNPSPKFFDISWVTRPADPTAYMLKKVAEDVPYTLIGGAAAGDYIDEMESRKLAAHKLAVIDKVVQGIPVDAKTEGVDPVELANIGKIRDTIMSSCQGSEPIDDGTLSALSSKSLPNIFSTAMSKGITFTTPEVVKIVIMKSGTGTEPSDRMMDNAVAMQRSILELFGDCPQLLDHFDNSGALELDEKYVDKQAEALLEPYMEKRSGIPEYLRRRLVPSRYREETKYTTPLSITDPATGTRYGTTRGAAIRAHDEIAKRNLYKVIGGGALLGGAYKMLSSGLRSRGMGNWSRLAALPLGYLGYKAMPSMGKHYMTDQGIPIPKLTELVKQSAMDPKSLALPLLGTLGMMAWMGHDYSSRLKQGIPIAHPYLPLSRRILDKVERFSSENPLIAGAAGAAGLYGLGRTRIVQGLSNRAAALRPMARTLRDKADEALTRFARPLTGKANVALDEFARPVSERAGKALDAVAGTTKLSHYLGSIIPAETDTVQLPQIDIDKVAECIGEIIVEA